MTKRFGFKMKLYPGFKEEYRKRHGEIWPELVKLLKNDVSGKIYIFKSIDTYFPPSGQGLGIIKSYYSFN